VRIETKEVKIVSLSISMLKPYVKRFFAWVHRGLTKLENWCLKRLTKWGETADKKLTERMDDIIED